MTLEYGVLYRTHKVPIIKLVKFFAVMNMIKKIHRSVSKYVGY